MRALYWQSDKFCQYIEISPQPPLLDSAAVSMDPFVRPFVSIYVSLSVV